MPTPAVEPPGLPISIESEPGSVVFRLAGEIDISNANTMPDLVLATEIPSGSEVVIDLSEVTFLDSSGLSAILTTHAGLRRNGQSMKLRNPKPSVWREFELTGLTHLFVPGTSG